MGGEGVISAAEPQPEAQDSASEQHCVGEKMAVDFRQMPRVVSLVVVSAQRQSKQSAWNTLPQLLSSSSRSSMISEVAPLTPISPDALGFLVLIAITRRLVAWEDLI